MTEIDLTADRSIQNITTVTPAQKDVKPAGGPVILRSVETTRLSD